MTLSVHVAGDGAGWAIDEEASNLRKTLGALNIRHEVSRWRPSHVIYHCDRYKALTSLSLGEKLLHRRVAMDYFHGKPESGRSFEKLIAKMRFFEPLIDRVRVSTTYMADLLESEGFEGKVQRIPIGVDVSRFSLASPENRAFAREAYSIPPQSVVVGSFQKDGDGWAGGHEPKRIKGPDILVETCEVLSRSIPNFLVLLAGPSRGYVESELRRRGVDYVRQPFVTEDELPLLYHALDLYIVSSREEGGPKAFLESMASGVALVSTPVGQIVDLSAHCEASIAEGFEPSQLAEKAFEILSTPQNPRDHLRRRALAEANSLESQRGQWREFFSEILALSHRSGPYRNWVGRRV